MTDEELIKKAKAEYAKRWRQAHPEKIKEYQRRWAESHPEGKKKKQEYTRKWQKAHPEKVKEYLDNYWTRKGLELQETKNDI